MLAKQLLEYFKIRFLVSNFHNQFIHLVFLLCMVPLVISNYIEIIIILLLNVISYELFLYVYYICVLTTIKY